MLNIKPFNLLRLKASTYTYKEKVLKGTIAIHASITGILSRKRNLAIYIKSVIHVYKSIIYNTPLKNVD